MPTNYLQYQYAGKILSKTQKAYLDLNELTPLDEYDVSQLAVNQMRFSPSEQKLR